MYNKSNQPRLMACAIVSASLLMTACSDDDNDNVLIETPPPAPTAAAAAMPSALMVGYPQTVSLSATGSAAASGGDLSYEWQQTAGTSVSLSSTTSADISFDMPVASAAETLTFEVTVSETGGTTSTAEVTVDIPAGSPSSCPAAVGNLTPTALVSPAAEDNYCQLSGVLTMDATVGSDYTWYLEGGLQIGSADASPTFTINAGTYFYGDNEGEVDYVYVWAGASIQALGTGANPVRFMSDDEGWNGAGEWGGVYIRGNGDAQGNNWLDYVVVAEAGASVEIGDTTYADNIVVNGADDGTRLTFVQSHDSARDGIRLYNTSARLSWILATGATRDGIWYRDFNGLVKDLMVIHRPESGRSGIYASASSETASSNPRFVNVTLVGRDGESVSAAADDTAREFGILFADFTRQGRYANILIANFRNGCYEVEPTGDISGFGYLDGIHCANEAGPNSDFGVVRAGGVDTANKGIGNGDGIRYYNGATNPITYTGETATREFTAGWYLATIGSLTNGLVADANALNGFRDGDTNGDGNVTADDVGATPFMGAVGPLLENSFGDITGFNHDVAADTNGYDLTHIGAVRSGSDANARAFNNWTVATGTGQGFAIGGAASSVQ